VSFVSPLDRFASLFLSLSLTHSLSLSLSLTLSHSLSLTVQHAPVAELAVGMPARVNPGADHWVEVR
jgi:hypothetical protein